MVPGGREVAVAPGCSLRIQCRQHLIRPLFVGPGDRPRRGARWRTSIAWLPDRALSSVRTTRNASQPDQSNQRSTGSSATRASRLSMVAAVRSAITASRSKPGAVESREAGVDMGAPGLGKACERDHRVADDESDPAGAREIGQDALPNGLQLNGSRPCRWMRSSAAVSDRTQPLGVPFAGVHRVTSCGRFGADSDPDPDQASDRILAASQRHWPARRWQRQRCSSPTSGSGWRHRASA